MPYKVDLLLKKIYFMKLQGAHRNSDALLVLSFCVYVRQRSCGVNCGEEGQNPAIL